MISLSIGTNSLSATKSSCSQCKLLISTALYTTHIHHYVLYIISSTFTSNCDTVGYYLDVFYVNICVAMHIFMSYVLNFGYRLPRLPDLEHQYLSL